MTRHWATIGMAAALTGTFGSAAAYAQQTQTRQAGRLEEVLVTATRRQASTQEIPVSVLALGSRELEELGVDNFQDYLTQLPGVTAGGQGPGQNQIYVRGLASTTPNLTTAGVAGLAPNVALYLDDQPLAQPGRNLDVYAVDLERIEVLPGPQGTLFGASSQAGTIRLITRKPVPNQFEAYANFGFAFTESGEMSNSAEAVVNIPVFRTAALRVVGYVDDAGGYIDNVPGTRDASESARFRPAGVVRANGVPVSDFRAGLQSETNVPGISLDDVTFLEATNAGQVEEDFNDSTYAGFRASALWDITPRLTLTVSHARQSLETEGVFFVDPELDDLQIQRFEEDDLEDDFANTAWTLEGRFDLLDFVYTGAFTNRETDQRVDYSDYLFVGQYLPYYICDGSVTYPGDALNPSGTCQQPNLFVQSETDTDVLTQEFRINTPDRYRIRATAGVFYSDLELQETNDFNYPGSLEASIFNPQPGFTPNFPFMTGFTSDPGPFPPGVIFRNDVLRTDEQFGIYGEVTFDVIPNWVSLVFGARYYDVEVDFAGSANASFCNGFQPDSNSFGTDISDLYNDDGQFTFTSTCNTDLQITFEEGQSVDEILAELQAVDPSVGEDTALQIFESLQAPDAATTDGVIFKGTVNVTPTRNTLFYFTYSEGFRPGLLNRPGGAQGPDGFTVPFELETDEVDNFEIGWKMDLFDRSLRFNGNAFYVDISNLQTTIFDPNLTNLFFSANAADAEIFGVEGNFTYFPPIPGLTLQGAFSFLDTEITDVLIPTGDVIEGSELAFAPTFQGNIRGRYEWPMFDDYTAHVQAQVTYSDSSFTDIIEINKIELDDYVLFGMTAGLRADRWSVEIYGENLNDSRAQISGNFVFDRQRLTLIRPRTIGLRLGFRY